MKISRDNYELYLVDYLDGNLSNGMIQEVKQFLSLNPDIHEEFNCFADESIGIPDINYNKKNQLKKIPYTASNPKSAFFQQQCVARIENLLNHEESIAFDEALKHDKRKQHEFELFTKTKLKTEQIIFNEKLTLKQANFSHVINPYNFEEYCVACSEGWLGQSGLVALNNYIKNNPHLAKVYELYSKLKVSPDYAIKYKDKISLKRTLLMRLRTSINLSVVASVAAVLVFGYILFNNPNISKQMNTVATEIHQKPKTKKTINQSATQNTYTKPVVLTQQNTEQSRNIAAEQETYPVNRQKELHLITPKTINNIECNKCTDSEIEMNKINVETNEQSISSALAVNSETNKNKVTPKSLVKSAIVVGIKGAEVITNGKVRVKQNEKNNKTIIGFNSKFLAFSTNIKN